MPEEKRLNPGRASGFANGSLTYPIHCQGIMMFGSAKSKQKKLESRYRQLMQESVTLSHSNRRKSDQKLAEAEKVREQLEQLEKGIDS